MNLQEIFSNINLPIHQRYSMMVDHLSFVAPIMKTDLWNEFNTSYPISADIFVEIDPVMVQKGKEKGLNAFAFSITDLPLENESVSTVIDLSTIDHIEDPFPALKEYRRVLKKEERSNCYIVCWMGNKASEKMTNWDGLQYYFHEIDFLKKIYQSGFYIEAHNNFAGLGDSQCYLEFFHLKLQPEKFSLWNLFITCMLKMNLLAVIPIARLSNPNK